MIFQGQKFCSHCGARADRAGLEPDKPLVCPRCRTTTNAISIGNAPLHECPRCEGLWADAVSLAQIRADTEKQAAVLGTATFTEPGEGPTLEKNIRYIPCPVCKKLMNRVNFAHCSNVVVDVCREHGTWFDKNELRRVVEFIRGGGLEVARAREMAALEEQQRKAKADRIAAAWSTQRADENPALDRSSGIAAVARVLNSLLE
jgi:Zn-finger nucleic acid-binding protein